MFLQETIFGPSLLRDERHDRDLGEAHVLLAKSAADATISYGLSGRLTKTDKNWVMLSVPNALVRGAFDALHEIGAELPLNSEGRLNGHISVFRPDEIEQIGGADKISELGHSFSYSLGSLRTCEPAGQTEMSRVWFIEVDSPSLRKLRASYGLSPLPKYPMHVTIAYRRKNVLRHNEVTKRGKDLSSMSSDEAGQGFQLKSGALGRLADLLQGVSVGILGKTQIENQGEATEAVRPESQETGSQEAAWAIKNSGTQDLEKNALAMSMRGLSGLQGLWGEGYTGLRKVAELCEFLRRHGPSSITKADTGKEEYQRQLRTDELRLGDNERTTEKSTKQSSYRIPGRNEDIGGVGRNSTAGEPYDSGPTQTRLVDGKIVVDTVADFRTSTKVAAEKCKDYKADECCPHCCARLERDPYSGTCNGCGKDWPAKKSAAHEYLQREMVDDLENIQRDDELTKLAGWLGMFDDADVLKLAGLDEAIATDEIGRNPVELLDESGFAGDFVPGRDDSSQLEALAVLLGLTATGAGTYALVNGQRKRKWRPRTKLAGVYEHLPKIRGFDSVAGAIPGAVLGSAAGLVKERLTKPERKRNYFRAAATGAGVGGILGAGAGNVIGDRTRRYLTNTVPVIGSGYDNKENVSAVSPFKVGPDGGREVDWHKLYEGAILDRPVVSTNKADVLAEGADRSTANRAVRYELFRRQLGVHANRPGDLLSGNRDGSYSLSPSSPAGTKAMELLLPPDSRQTDLRAWLNKVNDVGGSGVGAGLFRDVMGGQVVTTSPFGDRDLVNQLDRWDYSLRPNEKSLLLRGLLAKTVGDREFLERKAEPKIDYTRAGDKVDGQVDSLAKRWMMDNVVVDHNPWLKHRFLIDKFDGNTPISVRPMTGDGRKYEGGDWKYRWDAAQGKYVLER